MIEINQARALAGGVTPSDTPGFPVTLGVPGSYRLTGTLTLPDLLADGIVVSADHVTIDLNGFGIEGPVVCTGAPVVCTGPPGTGSGITYTGAAEDTVVTHGSVRGCQYGILVGDGSRIDTVYAHSNAETGIWAGSFSSVTQNRASNNGASGISCGYTCSLTGNISYSNAASGISAAHGSVVIGNVARANGYVGLYLNPWDSSGYAQNVLVDNLVSVVNGYQIGPNLCGAGTTCP